jgi:hypothetical protein
MGLQRIFWSWILLGHCFGFSTSEAESTALQFHPQRKLFHPFVVVLHCLNGEIIRRRYSKKVFQNLTVQDFLYSVGETSMEVSTVGNICPLKRDNKIQNLSIPLDEDGAYVLYELNPKRKPYRRFCSCTQDDRHYVLSQTLFE